LNTPKKTIPDYLIANKNRTPDPKGLKELIGIMKGTV
jgi:hypothetical protein